MCVIVDANRASAFFTDPFNGDYAPVVRWVNDRDGRLVYGGKLKAELERIGDVRRLLRQWSSAGRAVEVDESELAAEEKGVLALGLCRSNDHHVIALARCSGARVLCTNDQKLMADFRDARIVPRPRGKVYRKPEHMHLLTHSGSCGIRPIRRR